MILDIGGGGTDDAGQRGAKVVGDCAQKICTDPLLFCFVELPLPFCDDLILSCEFGGHGAGCDSDNQHADKCDRIPAQGKVDLKERISKAGVDEAYTEQRGKDTV